MQEYTTFNLQIPNNRVDVITALKGFIKAFKIEHETSQEKPQEELQEEWKAFFDKFGGVLSGADEAEKLYDEYRLKKYGK